MQYTATNFRTLGSCVLWIQHGPRTGVIIANDHVSDVIFQTPFSFNYKLVHRTLVTLHVCTANSIGNQLQNTDYGLSARLSKNTCPCLRNMTSRHMLAYNK